MRHRIETPRPSSCPERDRRTRAGRYILGMSLRGPRRRVATCLVLSGLAGLCGCDVLTDDPLTDSEMSVFLAEADSRAAGSRGKAFQATVAAAATQRSSIVGALSLSRVRSDAAADAKALVSRSGAIAGDLSQAESAGLEVKRSALNQAIQGDDVDVIRAALADLGQAVAAVESAVSSRRSSEAQDQVAPPMGESLPGAPGQGESGEPTEVGEEVGRPGEGEPEPHSQIGAPSDAAPSSAQGAAEPVQDPSSQGEQSQEP